MLCKCHWIVLYTVHVAAFCLGGRFFWSRCTTSDDDPQQEQNNWVVKHM